jgi:transketolase
VEDKFGRSGKPEPLLEMYGLTAKNIVSKVKEVIKMK